MTPDQILAQEAVPPRLVVIGSGFVATELALLFAHAGTQVRLLCAAPVILPGEDEEFSAEVQHVLKRRGIEAEWGASLSAFEAAPGALHVVFERDGARHWHEAEQVLVATGWVPHLNDLGLSEAGIVVSGEKIEVGSDFQTSTSGVYAIGDCIRRDGWASQAARDGHDVASVILGLVPAPPSHFVPRCLNGAPEMATVGLSLHQALELGIQASAFRSETGFDGRAARRGDSAMPQIVPAWIKLVFEDGTLRVLGCQMVGAGAGETIGEAALAIHGGLTLDDLAATLHAHGSPGQRLSDVARAASQSQLKFGGNFNSVAEPPDVSPDSPSG